MDISITNHLQKTGLSDKEIRVYTALLDLGGGYPSAIAKHTKLNRSTTYQVLGDLSIKGLINEITKKNKLYYQIEKPKKLLSYAEDQVDLAEDRLGAVKKIIPELESFLATTSHQPTVLFFKGKDEIRAIYEDHVSQTKTYEMLAFANASKLETSLPLNFFRSYIKKKEKLGITTRGILPDTQNDTTFVGRMYKGIKPSIKPQIKFIDKNLFPFETEVTVYGQNKVSITKMTSDNAMGVIIEDEIIYGTMKMIFEIAWKNIK